MGLENSDSAVDSSSVRTQRDEELISQARVTADVDARRDLLDRLFTRYHRRVGLWCLRITGDRDAAADLAQEILVKAYQALDSYRGESRFSTWLYTIARNQCFNDARRRAARPEGAAEPIDEDLPSPEQFESRIEKEQQLQQMRRLLSDNLDETEHRVMVLHYSEEMPLEVITRLLGLTNASGAKAYVVSARRKLKAELERRARVRAARKP